ncbi:nuclear transport factor 2 family protein [Clostridiales bacterium COT073_COT-073]|nr:nuclear transport factor 2 family protein [Clostridiales bacterium COT073_COT-073]
MQKKRENIIRLWFDMWLEQKDLGMDEIFTEDAIYIESWCPQYASRNTIKHWFKEWNTRGKVLNWEIKQFFHKADQTMVEWYFKNQMNNEQIEEFDGVSLIYWTENDQIKFLKEFGCNRNNYDPYENGDQPQFRDDKANWF